MNQSIYFSLPLQVINGLISLLIVFTGPSDHYTCEVLSNSHSFYCHKLLVSLSNHNIDSIDHLTFNCFTGLSTDLCNSTKTNVLLNFCFFLMVWVGDSATPGVHSQMGPLLEGLKFTNTKKNLSTVQKAKEKSEG